MHVRILFGVFAIGVLTILMSPVGYGQFQGGGGGGGFGGKGGGGFGGKGGNKGRDPNQSFDLMANGRQFILLSDVASPFMQQMLTQYQQESGANFPNGQISREQYVAATEFIRNKMAANGGFFGSKKGPGAAPGNPAAPGGAPAPTLESMQQLADIDFKSHDENGDGKLNQDEMPPPLKRDLARWDKNGDGVIDQNEYRDYFVAHAGAHEPRPQRFRRHAGGQCGRCAARG